MNAVTFDDNSTPANTDDDTLIINNLPFGGTDGVYVENQDLANGATVYSNQSTPTTGLTQTFAVFIRSNYLEVTSAASGQWSNFGYAGANVDRESFALPGGIVEYVYQGSYAAARTFDDRGRIEIVSGDINLRLDELGFDNDGALECAVDATVSNRQREGAAGAAGLGQLPNIVFAVTKYNPDTGLWEGGTAQTFHTDNTVRSTGLHEGLIAGLNGEEVGGYSIITGVADNQTVRYQIIIYETQVPTGRLDPVTGNEIFRHRTWYIKRSGRYRT
jgi:hypothetical protein